MRNKNPLLREAALSCFYILISGSLMRLIQSALRIDLPEIAFTGLISLVTLLPPVIYFRFRYKNTCVESERQGFTYSAVLSFSAFLVCIGLNIIISRFGSYNSNISAGDIPLAVLCSAVIPAVMEELLFRECLAETGLLISALLFGLVHSGAVGALFAFLCGIVLYLVRICTGSVIFSIAVHLLNNLTALAVSLIRIEINLFLAGVFVLVGGGFVALLVLKNGKKALSEQFSAGVNITDPCFIAFVILSMLTMLV